MTLVKEKLAENAAILLMVGFLFGSSVILPPGTSGKNEAWLAIILGVLLGLFFSLFLAALITRFPGKTLVEITDTVFGKFFGKAIMILYILYFFHLGSLVMTDTLFFLKIMVYPTTPEPVLLLVITLVCIYAVWKGPAVISKCGLVFVPLTMILFLLTTLLLFKEVNLKNLLPLAVPFKNLAWGSFQTLTFPFGETVIFLMVLPYLKNIKKVQGVYVKSFLLAGFFLLLGSLRTIGALGATANQFVFPGFSASRLMEFGRVFNRLEMFSGLNFVMMTFIKISVLLFGTVMCCGQVCKLKDYRCLIIPWGVLMLIYAMYNFGNLMESIESAMYTYPIYAVVFQFFIPLVVLLVAVLRGLPKERQS